MIGLDILLIFLFLVIQDQTIDNQKSSHVKCEWVITKKYK